MRALREQRPRRIHANDDVTFVEPARWFPAFRGGDQVILLQDNVVL
jgi:hypothetical protein